MTRPLQWGKEIHWAPLTHRFFPRQFRAAVRTLLLVRARKETPLNGFPRDAMMVLFKAMSLSANPSPFHPYPFPLVAKGEANNDY